MKVCSQCGKEINKVVIINRGEIICRACAKELKEIQKKFKKMMILQ